MRHIFYISNTNNFMYLVYSILTRLNKSIMHEIKSNKLSSLNIPVLGEQDGKDERDPQRVEHEEGEGAAIAHVVQRGLELLLVGQVDPVDGQVLLDELAPERGLALVQVAQVAELERVLVADPPRVHRLRALRLVRVEGGQRAAVLGRRHYVRVVDEHGLRKESETVIIFLLLFIYFFLFQ